MDKFSQKERDPVAQHTDPTHTLHPSDHSYRKLFPRYWWDAIVTCRRGVCYSVNLPDGSHPSPAP
ncbi:hypothetical protein CY34DRAFT_803084 [Suillus luteus UH-Slu-Lm8-n1]|uniref:Uncharacterized protein n=1 Tax=Suillus luteus UH-Slu-Lm8-n1 TaxID=930992 RepID=A0A0D0AQR5_9AGAM|nr:hypothetical protein CY34DRAFT_803084 [Suillus luteus UH-Slu-Lm8-n1]